MTRPRDPAKKDGTARDTPQSERPLHKATRLVDVARRAGVSLSTASRVLNGKACVVPVNEKTRERILAAARELSYTPNAIARALTSRQTHTIGVICYHIAMPDVPPFIDAVEASAEARGYRMMVCSARREISAEASDVSTFLSLLHEKRVDGIVIFSDVTAQVKEQLERLSHVGMPIALLGGDAPTTGVVLADFDHLAGGRAIADHLVNLGHRHVVFLGGEGLAVARRLAGLREGLERHGVRLVVKPLPEVRPHMEEGRDAVRELLDTHEEMTALVARNDSVALGALQALQQAGVRVPEDISVVGYGDYYFAAYLWPPLTTVRTPVAEAGQRITEALIEAISKRNPSVTRLVFTPHLVVRGSTGTPQSGALCEPPSLTGEGGTKR